MEQKSNHILNFKLICITVSFLFSALTYGQGQNHYRPSPKNLEARQWFEDAKFGLFVHWGVYSILGDGEWVMNNQNIPIDAYKKLPGFFNPTGFDADKLVKMAKNSGMKYITITSRHHDGFSMFDTEANDYNIVDGTPYGKDVLRQLAEACRKEDIKLFLYYSLLDWYQDDYYPRGKTGKDIPGRTQGDWDQYITFMKVQLTELLSNYGEIAGIWFDGYWDQVLADEEESAALQVDWHLDEIYELIHTLQPQCLIGNNHHLAPIEGEDFQMFEKDLPGKNTSGWGTSASNIGRLPFEVCETINGSWGFDLQDKKHKSKKELIHYIVKAAGYGSNLLLNVGPMPNGNIQEEHINSLKQIGKWMNENGETIYKTLAGPILPTEEMASTQKGNTIYLHVLDQNDKIFVKDFDKKIRSLKLFKDKTPLKYSQNTFGLLIKIPKDEIDPIDTIVEITLK